MRTIGTIFLTTFCVLVIGAGNAGAQNIHDTRLLSQPAVSAEHVAFEYAGDLWVADLDSGNVRRLTSHVGSESGPRFSPDGSLIAFTAQYEGNTDVYLRATPSDADGGNVVGEFSLWPTGGATTVRNVTVSSGVQARTLFLKSSLTDGVTYNWRVRTKDSDGAASGYSATCSFTVDKTLPTADVDVTSTQYPAQDPAGTIVSTVPAGIPGQFTHPDYQRAVERVVWACERNGKAAGFMVSSIAEGRSKLAQGFRCLAYWGDLWIYGQALAAGIAGIKEGGT